MGTETVAIVPTLRSDYAALPNRHQQALDWYLKGIHAPVDSDRYVYSVNGLFAIQGVAGVGASVRG